ncbi:MAG: hypothetical protein KC731_21370 [Myxococcales bacterium]|nr:hypothetical protein [Myxococcales bacterium]
MGRWSFVALSSAFLMLSAACGADGATETNPDGGGGVSPGNNATLAFEADGTLTLTPGEKVDLTVRATPPASYALSVLLVGETLDASLDGASLITGADGRASFALRAPNSPASFRVRAKLDDGPFADLQVAVSDQGFGSLAIDPVYNGHRDPSGWSAFVVSGKTCEGLSGESEDGYPDDPAGAFEATAGPEGELFVDIAPVGPNLAVFVRSEHYLWGCTNVPDLVAEATTKVTVHIKDRPVDVSNIDLDVSLAFEPEPAEWAQLLAASQAEMLGGLLGGQSLPEALLAAMEGSALDPVAFADASSNGGWEGVVSQHVNYLGIDLPQLVGTWAAAGLPQATGAISGRLAAIPEEAGYATFIIDHIGTATPDDLGVPDEYVVTVAVDSDDTARVGGKLFWRPSRFVTAAVAHEALSSQPAGTTMADLLSETLQCDMLAADLAQTTMTGCDQACLEQLCRDGLASMWEAAADASAENGTTGEIPFQASGESSLDDEAKLLGFEGMWLGNVEAAGLSAKVSGLVVAQTPVIE